MKTHNSVNAEFTTFYYHCLDRQVVLGNHRDAWVFGAVDPNSGTAVLMNLAKAIGYLRGNSSKYYDH